MKKLTTIIAVILLSLSSCIFDDGYEVIDEEKENMVSGWNSYYDNGEYDKGSFSMGLVFNRNMNELECSKSLGRIEQFAFRGYCYQPRTGNYFRFDKYD